MKIDARRRLRQATVDHVTGGGEVRPAAGRLRRRRRSLYARIPSQTGDDETAWPTSPTSSGYKPLAPAGSDDSVPPDDSSLCDRRSSAVRRRSQRSTCVSFTREHVNHRRRTSPRISATDTVTSDNIVTTTDAPFRLQLQARVKVAQRPVRCLVNARYYCRAVFFSFFLYIVFITRVTYIVY